MQVNIAKSAALENPIFFNMAFTLSFRNRLFAGLYCVGLREAALRP
jgi:hypothetical protein